MNMAEKLITIAEKQQAVYDAGYAKGIAQGGDSTYFWDVYQDYGKRTNYGYAFYRWDGSIFNPVHSMAPTGDYGADSMFAYATNMGDVKSLLESKGVELNFSGVTRLNSTFQSCSASKLPDINLSGCTKLALAFYNMPNLTELTLTNLSSTCTFDRVFNYSHKLEHLNISGVIGKNGFTLEFNSGISAESIDNILDILEDKTGDTSGTEWKITLGSTNKNKASATALADAEAKGWVIV